MASTLGYQLLLIISINTIMLLSQASLNELGNDSPQFYNCTNTIFGSAEANNCQNINNLQLIDQNPTNNLPSTGTDIEVGSGNLFTDTFSSISSWFTQLPGIKYIYSILTAPYKILTSIGIPSLISATLSMGWYLYTLLVIIAFMWGRDY